MTMNTKICKLLNATIKDLLLNNNEYILMLEFDNKLVSLREQYNSQNGLGNNLTQADLNNLNVSIVNLTSVINGGKFKVAISQLSKEKQNRIKGILLYWIDFMQDVICDMTINQCRILEEERQKRKEENKLKEQK